MSEEIKEEEVAPTYYVGESKVTNIHVTDNVDLVGVLYENGKEEDFTTEQWEGVKSETPYPIGEVSVRKHEALMVRILKLMVAARITMGEQEWLLEGINRSIVDNYQKAVAKLFSVPYKEKIFLADIDQVLKSEVKE